MAENVEEKWPRGIVASLLFLCVLVLMLATLAPNSMVDAVLLKERQWGNELLGSTDMDKVLTKTDAWYSALVLDSGAKAFVADVMLARGGTVEAFERNVDGWFVYLEGRGVAVQKILYQMIYRIALAFYWLPLLGVVLVPAVYAGWMRWNIKRHGFGYSSPLLNSKTASLLCWGGVLVVLSVLVPLPLPPLLLSTFIVIMLPLLLSVLISNLPKRI